MDPLAASQIRQDPRLVALQKKRDSFAWTLAIIMLVVYYGFIFLVAFRPDIMGMNVGGVVTLGSPLGLGVILLAIILTGVYVARANGEFDRMTTEIVAGVQQRSGYAAGNRQTIGAAR
ncbi:MAG TPA: DUF485 domain-containing protein [Acidisphaera sp.]|nr:DUF485 domain-containing protein [Acidisphaera sp.]